MLKRRLLLRVVCLLPAAFALLLSSANGDAANSLHARYQAVDDPVARRFLHEGLFRAQALLGAPVLPVRSVHLRLSRPLAPDSKLRSNFRMTELVDVQNGIFAIYVSRTPGEYAFEGQLAHEVAHLLNAQLFDIYAEGLCTVFAERFLTEQGLDFSSWRKHFESGAEPLYGLSYQMMREVWTAAGDENMRRMLTFARPATRQGEQEVDINAWLATLEKEKRSRVRSIILRYAQRLQAAIAANERPLSFLQPAP
jgi:hypothetical protein